MPKDDLRCFIAVPVPEPVRRRLTREIGYLQLAGAAVKWVGPDNFHLTIRFIGEVRPDEIIGICDAIEEACEGVPASRLSVRGIDSFPRNSDKPRVIIAPAEGEIEPLKNLYNGLQRNLAKVGFRPEKKGIVPHVTLGRLRGASNPDLLERMGQGKGREFGVLPVEKIHLMMSDMLPQGPVYSSMKEFALAPPE